MALELSLAEGVVVGVVAEVSLGKMCGFSLVMTRL